MSSFSTSELQALVIADSTAHPPSDMRNATGVPLNLLDHWHCFSTIIWMFCTISSFPRRLRVLSALMTSSSLSGDVFLSFLISETLCVAESSFFSACCGAFSARTKLLTHSPTRTFNTSFSTLIAGHRILRRVSDSQTRQSNHHFACCWHCSFFHGSWGPIRGCFSFRGPWVPSLPVFLSSHPCGT